MTTQHLMFLIATWLIVCPFLISSSPRRRNRKASS